MNRPAYILIALRIDGQDVLSKSRSNVKGNLWKVGIARTFLEIRHSPAVLKFLSKSQSSLCSLTIACKSPITNKDVSFNFLKEAVRTRQLEKMKMYQHARSSLRFEMIRLLCPHLVPQILHLSVDSSPQRYRDNLFPQLLSLCPYMYPCICSTLEKNSTLTMPILSHG